MNLSTEQESYLDRDKDLIETFKEHCETKGLKLESKHFEFVPTIGIVAKYPNILFHLESRLKIDKENLVDCESLHELFEMKPAVPGYLYSDKFVAFLSPVFRRNMSKNNNWAPDFVNSFWQYETFKGTLARKKIFKGILTRKNGTSLNIQSCISLDYDRVRINLDNSICIEEDFRYGAPFDIEVANITDGMVQLNPPRALDDSEISRLFKNAYSLDICWSTKDTIKTFQSLEFKNEKVRLNINGVEYFPAKYIHAEFNLEKGFFRHFDGAVQYYTKQEYFARRDSNFRHNFKNAEQIKAHSSKSFKFNGELPVNMWTEFCSHYFSGNPLIFEYFSGAYPSYLIKQLEGIRSAQY